jgi:RHS repeat-associated protein
VVAIDHTRGNAVALRWLLYDGHGNLVRLMAPDYTLSAFQWRGVWGEVQGSLGAGRGYCANLGHPEDETGLVYMRARYYEPATGRFISEDPARDGVNWYLYADGNPVNKVDKDGFFTLLDVVAGSLADILTELRQIGAVQALGSAAKGQVLRAIAYLGYLAGYLVALDMAAYSWPLPNVIRHSSGLQIHIEHGAGHHGYPHVDLQGGAGFEKLQRELKKTFGMGRLPADAFLRGFLTGFWEGLL